MMMPTLNFPDIDYLTNRLKDGLKQNDTHEINILENFNIFFLTWKY